MEIDILNKPVRVSNKYHLLHQAESTINDLLTMTCSFLHLVCRQSVWTSELWAESQGFHSFFHDCSSCNMVSLNSESRRLEHYSMHSRQPHCLQLIPAVPWLPLNCCSVLTFMGENSSSQNETGTEQLCLVRVGWVSSRPEFRVFFTSYS